MKRGLILFFWLLGSRATAAELAPLVDGGALGVRIDGLAFPTTLPGDLRSGLTNRLFLRLTLLDRTTAIQQHTVEIAIRYDLWDETFEVTRTVDDAAADSQPHRSQGDVQALLSALSIPRVFATAGVPADRTLTLHAELLLNPIRREKLRMIRKWVAENSTPGLGSDRGPSASSTIFNRIFEQYADGSDIAAPWRAVLDSRPFHPGAVNERR